MVIRVLVALVVVFKGLVAGVKWLLFNVLKGLLWVVLFAIAGPVMLLRGFFKAFLMF